MLLIQFKDYVRKLLLMVSTSLPVIFWYGSGSGSFSSVTFKMKIRNNFFLLFSAYYFLKAHLHHSSKIKSHKIVEIKVFLNIFAG